MKSLKISTKHYGQIIVSEYQYNQYIDNIGSLLYKMLLYCIAKGPNDCEYKTRLLAISLYLQETSRMLCCSDDIPFKKNQLFYERTLFENYIESVDEVALRLKALDLQDIISPEDAFAQVQAIRTLISRMLSNDEEMLFTSEYADAIDTILKKNSGMNLSYYNLAIEFSRFDV